MRVRSEAAKGSPNHLTGPYATSVLRKSARETNCRHALRTRLSYADPGSCAKKEPARARPFMARAGGGWIVTGLVVMDRFRV